MQIDELDSLSVGDSTFTGFARRIESKSGAVSFQSQLKRKYPDAAHVPLCWVVPSIGAGGAGAASTESSFVRSSGFDEDGEPPDSAGPLMLDEILSFLRPAASESPGIGIALVIVRFFGVKLLGVTCGRLPQCYRRTSRLALHRLFHPGTSLEENFVSPAATESLYGLAAGDTELILNVVSDVDGDLMETVRDELEFGGFRGAKDEVLPRLQNLQADVSNSFMPVYRYPGNYQGDEWETYQWSQTSLKIKKSVEESLAPLVAQKMNHCVTNWYRHGEDNIAHHSDKDLDLNRKGVIVSVSLGDERVLELRRRAEPRDIVRISLPHCSMLVLGPNTNRLFTHSILKKEGSSGERISLTLREVKTFLDRKTGRMWGQGVSTDTFEEATRADSLECNVFLFGLFAFSTAFLDKRQRSRSKLGVTDGIFTAGVCAGMYWIFQSSRRSWRKRREESSARDFFSRTSASGTKYN